MYLNAACSGAVYGQMGANGGIKMHRVIDERVASKQQENTDNASFKTNAPRLRPRSDERAKTGDGSRRAWQAAGKKDTTQM